MKKAFVLGAATVAVLVLAGAALAGGSLVTSYGGQAQQALVKTSSATKSGQAPAKASGGLPFTGVDLGVILAGGAVLVLTGVVLRRTARQKP